MYRQFKPITLEQRDARCIEILRGLLALRAAGGISGVWADEGQLYIRTEIGPMLRDDRVPISWRAAANMIAWQDRGAAQRKAS